MATQLEIHQYIPYVGCWKYITIEADIRWEDASFDHAFGTEKVTELGELNIRISDDSMAELQEEYGSEANEVARKILEELNAQSGMSQRFLAEQRRLDRIKEEYKMEKRFNHFFKKRNG